MPLNEALALGFLMNSKGLVELIVLNIGKDRKTFAIMILMAFFTTFITTPLVTAIYKPARKVKKLDYKHRTIERKNPSSELHILACFHSSRNIPSVINLLEASRGTQKLEGLCVYAMHLMELTERSSAILMVQKARRNGLPIWNKGPRSHQDQVVVAFEAFRQLSLVSFRLMTSISSFSDMYEDITAERKRATMIILPLHKHQRLDGSLETTPCWEQLVVELGLDLFAVNDEKFMDMFVAPGAIDNLQNERQYLQKRQKILHSCLIEFKTVARALG